MARKHRVKMIPMNPSNELKLNMPFWFHIGRPEQTQNIHNDTTGKCLRNSHKISTVRQAVLFIESFDAHTHTNNKDCCCVTCLETRQKGCKNPEACRKSADRKLKTLHPVWDPRNPAIQTRNTEYEPPPMDMVDAQSVPAHRMSSTNSDNLMESMRVFTSWPKDLPNVYPNLSTPRPSQTSWDSNKTIVYTDGSCMNNGTDEARAGSGIWYAHEDPRNKTIRLPGGHQSNNTGEMMTAIHAIQANKTYKQVDIISDSTYVINSATTYLPRWLDEGFIGVKNMQFAQALAGELLNTDSFVSFKKVKGHSRDEGNEEADKLAAAGAAKEAPDEIDLSAGDLVRSLGANLQTMTQSLLYKNICALDTVPNRQRTSQMLEITRNAIAEINGSPPTNEAIWRSVNSGPTMSKKARTFLWKSLHGGLKVGNFWKHTGVSAEFMPCSICDAPVESLNHILLECKATGQEKVWSLVQDIWQRTEINWPNITLGTILGCGAVTFKTGEDEQRADGISRLFTILVSEASLLIWNLRCEWHIGRKQDPQKLHSHNEIEHRWKYTINQRLRFDRILTNVLKFERKALSSNLVERTWQLVLDDSETIPNNWVHDLGVLVIVGRVKRPPGQNR